MTDIAESVSESIERAERTNRIQAPESARSSGVSYVHALPERSVVSRWKQKETRSKAATSSSNKHYLVLWKSSNDNRIVASINVGISALFSALLSKAHPRNAFPFSITAHYSAERRPLREWIEFSDCSPYTRTIPFEIKRRERRIHPPVSFIRTTNGF